jgi:hypothetical protein
LAVALSFCCLLGLGCPKQAFLLNLTFDLVWKVCDGLVSILIFKNFSTILRDNSLDFYAGSRYFCESLFWASQPNQAQIPLSTGSIYNFNEQMYPVLQRFEDWVKRHLLTAFLAHVDETSMVSFSLVGGMGYAFIGHKSQHFIFVVEQTFK